MKNFVLAAVVAVTLGGCSAKPASAGSGAKQAPLTAATIAKAEAALSSYEALRAQLADDKLTSAPGLAAHIAKHAKAAAQNASGSPKAQLSAVAKAALAIRAGTPNAVRKAFGELSRTVVTMLAAQPALAKGRYAFICPMAQGYQKWVQTSAKIENPYMGHSMLRCGGATKLTP